MRVYHYSVRIGHGKATFPTVTLRSLLKSLAFHKGHGVQFLWLATSQTYLSTLFNCQRSQKK
ncbi:TPA: transposase [Enterococcus faecalis]|uniref:Transposase n=1 Tax=Enterococcus cecorum TaxID=44008 RepID=A0A7X9RLJ0_9ENTE|nr:transposase [Enterococcus gallinarum]NME50607.1 transposase [Enterococcus cecorum]HAP3403231.1 transposase [Enterococcus faecalis]